MTVECIAGLRAPDAGTISVLDLDPQQDRTRLRHLLGMRLQESRLPDKLRVAEALRLYASFYTEPADWQALLVDLGLDDKRDARFGTLSGGQKQRLSVARSCSSARRARRPTCCTSTTSWGCATGPPRSARRSGAAWSPDHRARWSSVPNSPM